jgi:ribonuclease HII
LSALSARPQPPQKSSPGWLAKPHPAHAAGNPAPHRVLVDGNRLPALSMAADAIVKGDAKVRTISAASILAKVHRDRLCVELHAEHPQYGFDGHKGYPTPAHLAALREHGACVQHRRSFAPVRAMLQGAADALGLG